MRIDGREYSRAELLQRVGRIEQIGGVEATVLDEGAGRGTRALRFTSAAGLTATVLPDRGMDILDFRWRGRSLCWQGACGPASPALYQQESVHGFLRQFYAGMLTTCGLSTFGPASDDAGEHLPQHGLASQLPASAVAWGHEWEGDRCVLYARGATRQWRLFGEHLTLHRHLRMDLDGSSMLIEDVVRNEGYEPAPHMILYHCNAGFPLLDEGAQVHGRFASVEARDEEARHGIQDWARILGPRPHIAEQVFLTSPQPDDSHWSEATLWNPSLDGGLGLRLRWDARTLPWMLVWRMLGEGAYVLGLEPVNCPTIEGRAAARAAGTLPILAPGEERRYSLELAVVTEAPAEPA